MEPSGTRGGVRVLPGFNLRKTEHIYLLYLFSSSRRTSGVETWLPWLRSGPRRPADLGGVVAAAGHQVEQASALASLFTETHRDGMKRFTDGDTQRSGEQG